MYRRLDRLGRVVLPIELRNVMDIQIQDGLEIFVDEDKIILRKYDPTCCFCKEAANVTSFKSKYICNNCRNEFKK
jgi:transcriptional pleiotropic regulator of transition state genes